MPRDRKEGGPDALPAGLSNLEQRLRLAALPKAGVDRDAVMYQAGYAAAQRELRRGGPLRAIGLPLSAAAAACLATVLWLQPARDLRSEAALASSTESGSESPPTYTSPPETIVATPAVVRLPVRVWSDEAPFLALRERALRSQWVDYSRPARLAVEPEGGPKSSREILSELLPSDAS
ncbi:MAG: hypothetical protein AAGA92_05255 [Planctomycetota bacterium]